MRVKKNLELQPSDPQQVQAPSWPARVPYIKAVLATPSYCLLTLGSSPIPSHKAPELHTHLPPPPRGLPTPVSLSLGSPPWVDCKGGTDGEEPWWQWPLLPHTWPGSEGGPGPCRQSDHPHTPPRSSASGLSLGDCRRAPLWKPSPKLARRGPCGSSGPCRDRVFLSGAGGWRPPCSELARSLARARLRTLPGSLR